MVSAQTLSWPVLLTNFNTFDFSNEIYNLSNQLIDEVHKAKQLNTPFHYIFNKSLEAQLVPEVWKDAVVVPVPKSNTPKTLNDFRPVALTSVVIRKIGEV